MDFAAWQSGVHSALLELLGDSKVSRKFLSSGLVVWSFGAAGTTVTAGPEDHSGLAYLSFSDGRANVLVKLDPDSGRAARYIATRLSES